MLCGGKLIVNTVKTSVLQNQLERCFFPDSGNAGNVIRAISHQCLDVHEGRGRDTVLLHKFFLVHIHRFAVGGKQNVYVFADQLKRVAVSRHQISFRVCLAAHLSEGTENIVRLVSFQFKNVISHCHEQLLGNGKLLCQLLRHRLAPRLVGIKHFVTEGGRLEVKRHRAIIGRERVCLTRDHGDKTVERIGGKTVLGRQRTHSVKGTVENTVAVNGE